MPDKDATSFFIAAADFAPRWLPTIFKKWATRNVISMDGGWRGWTEAGFPDHQRLGSTYARLKPEVGHNNHETTGYPECRCVWILDLQNCTGSAGHR